MSDIPLPTGKYVSGKERKLSLFSSLELQTAENRMGTFYVASKSFIDVGAIPTLTKPILCLLLKDKDEKKAEFTAIGDIAERFNNNIEEQEIYRFEGFDYNEKQIYERTSWKDVESKFGHLLQKTTVQKLCWPEVKTMKSDLNNKSTTFSSIDVAEHFSRVVLLFLSNHPVQVFNTKNGEGKRQISEFLTSDGVTVHLTGFNENIEFVEDLEPGQVYVVEGCLANINSYSRETRIDLTYSCFTSFNKIESKEEFDEAEKITLAANLKNFVGKKIEIELLVRGDCHIAHGQSKTFVALDGNLHGKFVKVINVECNQEHEMQNHDIVNVQGILRERGNERHSISAINIKLIDRTLSEEERLHFKHPVHFM